MTRQIPATIVNHAAIQIAAPPDVVWRAIQEEYVEAKKFRAAGTIEALDDPAAVLSYRMRIHQEGQIDERVVRITERDHAARRLSAHADYLTVPAGGMGVWVTYQAHEIPLEPGGTRYTIDSHARLGLDVPGEGNPADVGAAMAAMKAAFDTALLAYLERIKATLEGAG